MQHLIEMDFLPFGVLIAAALVVAVALVFRNRGVRRAPAWPALAAGFFAIVVIGWTTAMILAPHDSPWRDRFWIPMLGVLVVISLLLIAIRNSKAL
jgi:hypothetical protein